MVKSIEELSGNLYSLFDLDRNNDESGLQKHEPLFIPFANESVSKFNIMIIGSRPSNGRTLLINEILIANSIIRPQTIFRRENEQTRSLAYFLTEQPKNYLKKLITGILETNRKDMLNNILDRMPDEQRFYLNRLTCHLMKCPLFIGSNLPSDLNDFRESIESDIEKCKPGFIFLDGLEHLAPFERNDFEDGGASNIDPFLRICVEISERHSIPFIISRLLTPRNDRAFDMFRPTFADFNSCTIDSDCDIVFSVVRTAYYNYYNEPEPINDTTVQFIIHRDRTGTLSGKYQSDIDCEVPRMIFPEKQNSN
ncbi:MAG: DnaB-like helicase C-terminal domain-containing protein [Bacteroidales bacterium]